MDHISIFSPFACWLGKGEKMLSNPFYIFYREIGKRKPKGRYIQGPISPSFDLVVGFESHNFTSHHRLCIKNQTCCAIFGKMVGTLVNTMCKNNFLHFGSTSHFIQIALKLLGRYSISQEISTRFLLCCALLWLYIDWFSHIHQAYFTGTVAI